MRVGEICDRHAVIIGRSDSIYHAAVLMREQHANYIVVVEPNGGNNIPVGAISDREIVVDFITQRLDLDAVAVGEVMHAPVLVANENDGVMPTLKRMRHNNVRYIPVVTTNGALFGVLSIENILDMLSEQLDDIGCIVSRAKSTVHDEIVEKHSHA